MKKAIVYIIAALLALSALAGCGMSGDRNNTTVSPTPDMTTPDVNNGVVNDHDGIITDDDNGRVHATATPGNNGTNGTIGTDDANGGMNGQTGTNGDLGTGIDGDLNTGMGTGTAQTPGASASPSAAPKATEKP